MIFKGKEEYRFVVDPDTPVEFVIALALVDLHNEPICSQAEAIKAILDYFI